MVMSMAMLMAMAMDTTLTTAIPKPVTVAVAMSMTIDMAMAMGMAATMPIPTHGAMRCPSCKCITLGMAGSTYGYNHDRGYRDDSGDCSEYQDNGACNDDYHGSTCDTRHACDYDCACNKGNDKYRDRKTMAVAVATTMVTTTTMRMAMEMTMATPMTKRVDMPMAATMTMTVAMTMAVGLACTMGVGVARAMALTLTMVTAMLLSVSLPPGYRTVLVLGCQLHAPTVASRQSVHAPEFSDSDGSAAHWDAGDPVSLTVCHFATSLLSAHRGARGVRVALECKRRGRSGLNKGLFILSTAMSVIVATSLAMAEKFTGVVGRGVGFPSRFLARQGTPGQLSHMPRRDDRRSCLRFAEAWSSLTSCCPPSLAHRACCAQWVRRYLRTRATRRNGAKDCAPPHGRRQQRLRRTPCIWQTAGPGV